MITISIEVNVWLAKIVIDILRYTARVWIYIISPDTVVNWLKRNIHKVIFYRVNGGLWKRFK